MFDNIWRTIGLGHPMTVTQMLGRAIICLTLCICWFMLDVTGTFMGWFAVVVMGVIAGYWLGRVMGLLDDQLLVEATENIADMLKPIAARTPVLDPDVDYVVNPGEPCWTTVGNYSVRIVQRDGGGASVQVFHLNREDEMPINSFEG